MRTGSLAAKNGPSDTLRYKQLHRRVDPRLPGFFVVFFHLVASTEFQLNRNSLIIIAIKILMGNSHVKTLVYILVINRLQLQF